MELRIYIFQTKMGAEGVEGGEGGGGKVGRRRRLEESHNLKHCQELRERVDLSKLPE